MTSYLFILISLLTLVFGHPVQKNPLLDGNPVSPVPKLSPRTDVSVIDEPAEKGLEKRQEIQPYQCSQPGLVFCQAFCDHNDLVWQCIRLQGRTRIGFEQNRKPCGDLICVPEFLGSTNNRPDRGCGAKAACVSISRMVAIFAKSGSTTCQGVNGDYKGKRPRLVSIIFDTANLAKKIFTPRAPDQITLTDGANKLVQAVGPADEQNGQFISLPFSYIGGVKDTIHAIKMFSRPSASSFVVNKQNLPSPCPNTPAANLVKFETKPPPSLLRSPLKVFHIIAPATIAAAETNSDKDEDAAGIMIKAPFTDQARLLRESEQGGSALWDEPSDMPKDGTRRGAEQPTVRERHSMATRSYKFVDEEMRAKGDGRGQWKTDNSTVPVTTNVTHPGSNRSGAQASLPYPPSVLPGDGEAARATAAATVAVTANFYRFALNLSWARMPPQRLCRKPTP
ncbi:hypothetical protein BC567DRAFT_286597 [Phyllosticta citribraziliensis]